VGALSAPLDAATAAATAIEPSPLITVTMARLWCDHSQVRLVQALQWWFVADDAIGQHIRHHVNAFGIGRPSGNDSTARGDTIHRADRNPRASLSVHDHEVAWGGPSQVAKDHEALPEQIHSHQQRMDVAFDDR
jgi:hypothetical protein